MNVQKISREYFSYIEKNTHFNNVTNESIEIVTPFEDSFGEGISFVLKSNNNHFVLTDQGFTLWNLSNYGIDLLTKNSYRSSILLSRLRYSGFELSTGNEISKKVSSKELPQAIHDFTQLLINLYDFSLTSKRKVVNFFFDDVKDYFSNNRHVYNYFQDFSIVGKSQLHHKIDFLFSSEGKNKLAKVHNKLNSQQVNNILVSWLDTVDKRKVDYNNNESLYIILSNDGFNSASDQHISALNEYDIQVVNFDDKKVLEKSFSK